MLLPHLQKWYVEPKGAIQYTKPVILLINRFSISEAEVFTLAMRGYLKSLLFGDANQVFLQMFIRNTLPNGWTFRCPYNLIKDASDFCWEGIGIPADVIKQLPKKTLQWT